MKGRRVSKPVPLLNGKGHLSRPGYATKQTKIVMVYTQCHQVFSRFCGVAILPGGEKIEVRDLTAFCEHVANRG